MNVGYLIIGFAVMNGLALLLVELWLRVADIIARGVGK